MKKLLSIILIALVDISILIATPSAPSPVNFSIEFGKEGVYEFGFYDYGVTKPISTLVFAPQNATQLQSTPYETQFAVKWNIASPLDYKLWLEFASTSGGSNSNQDYQDFMLKHVSSDIGLNYSYKYTSVDGATGEYEIPETERNAMIGGNGKESNKRFVKLKEGYASDGARTGSAKIDLTLNPPKADGGGYSFIQGQYVGYVRLILEVG